MSTTEPRQGRTSLRRGMWMLSYFLVFLPASAIVRHAGDVLHRRPDPPRASYFRISPPRR